MTLSGNGYPKNWIKLDRCTGEESGVADISDEEPKPLATAAIPYIQGLNGNIGRLLRGYNIRTAFKSSRTLGRMLTKVKDPVPPEERTGVVHKIGCICGDVYIGETSQSMSTRIKEHKAACRLANFERSTVAEHACLAGWSQHRVGQCRNLGHGYGLHKQTHKRSSSYKATDNIYMQNEQG